MSHDSGSGEQRSGQIELILRQIDGLPTLAPVAMRLMRIGNIEDADLDHIVEIIEADPPLTARLLGLCRRADKGLGDRITTLRRAVVMLGLETVQAAALSVAVFEVMQNCSVRVDDEISSRAHGSGDAPGGGEGPQASFDRAGYWRHCIAVATASERIAESHPGLGVRPEEAFVAGLLHDLGKLVLHVVLPKAYARILGLAERRHCSSAEVELQILGLDHHIAGRRIAEHWGLPPALRDVIWLRGQPAEAIADQPHRNLIAVIGIARALCRHLHLGWCGDFNHPDPIDGPRGLCARLSGEHAPLKPAAVHNCAAGLHEAVLMRCSAMGLGEQSTPELLMQSLGAANRRLGRLSAELRARTESSQAHLRALEATIALHEGKSTQRGVLEALAGIVASAGKALGPGFYATVHQMRAGDTWYITLFRSDGRVHRSHAIDTPHDRDTGRSRSLSELGQAPTSLNAMAALPWLADHLVDASDLGKVQVLALTPGQGGAAAALLHDTPVLADSQAMKALVASWTAAFAAAADHDSARRFAEQLASSNRALAEAETRIAEMQSLARLGEMAAGAAHEMNNPLAIISGRAEMLAEQAASMTDRAAAAAIVEASRRLSDLITAMSAIANPPPPTPGRTPIREVAEEAIRQASERTGITTHVELESDPGAEAIIDRKLIAAAVSELVANALEAAPNGNVRVRTEIVPADGRLIVSVIDDGAGMSPRTQEHAFDPFFSERPAGRRTGLGLTRARRLVELHGGHIRLISQKGQGTTATIELPMWQAPIHEAQRHNAGAVTATHSDQSLKAA